MKLYEHQERIVEAGAPSLRSNGILYIAAEPRVGKTLASMAIAERHGAKNVLFVTKKKAIASILNDYDRFGFNFELIVINYESLHKCDKKWHDMIILDESHSSISGFPKPSKTFKTVKEHVGSRPVIFLSGTPNPESYSQLYHQFAVSKNSPWSDYKTFYKWAVDYVNVTQDRRGAYMVNNYSDADKKRIVHDISPFFFTMSQADAGFDTKIEEKFITCMMKPETNKLIKTLLRDKLAYYGDVEILADTAAKLSQKVHQLIGGTIKTEEGSFTIDDSKAMAIKKRFKGEKIVIFYKFKQELELLKSVFECNTASPEHFNEHAGEIAFLGQYQSAREGINLSSADHIVFYNLDFSAVSYFQARERIITKTKTRDSSLWWVFSDTRIEKKIHKALSAKKDFTLSYFRRELL